MTYESDEEFIKNFEQSLDSLQEELKNQPEEEEEEETAQDSQVDEDLPEDDVEPEEEAELDETVEQEEEQDHNQEIEEEKEENEPAPVPQNEGLKEQKPEQKEPVQDSDINYKEFYETVMKPFKANGKTIELRNAQEAIQLMQMGANYTRKMQEISKHRKTIATLQENGITTDEELAFLLDLKNKNPEAIKKFFKDNNIDPFDVDTSTEVNYKPKVKMVSEEVLETRAILEELNSDPEGAKTLRLIADTWDDESTRFMWNNPSAFKIIHEQRVSGVYDQIMNEIDRQTTLGILHPHGSILEKYNIVGNQLFGQPQNDTTKQPIDTRKASRSSAPSSTKRAKAARAPNSGKRTSSVVLEDLMNLDDDKFLEAMKNRL
ncbi:hypothetical protein ZC03_022 [Pseudomonas phage ZC03]|uniref:Tape measure protein n=1 Tax=Pseudomonas phage ZC03 TaxID=1622115 RepID=A0A1L2C930_9CAUD|nr:tail length tape measure protein [Pseudomonas phage ZC03]AMD43409.1 hypothetical protein ZC03_022 [Pseudomonas phage ZC03]